MTRGKSKTMEKYCKNCGKKLTGHQTTWCSVKCSRKWYKVHPKKYVDTAPSDDVGIIREFECKKCGKRVWVTEESDLRTVFCSRQCESNYWKKDYLKDTRHSKSGNNLSSGMSLESLIRREKWTLE